MASFKDQNGKEWRINLDAPTIQMVRDELEGFDLAAPEGADFDRAADDPVLLVNILWLVCREQAENANISDRQFGEALVGDAIDSATKALLTAISDFFPSRKRMLLSAITAKNEKLRELGAAKALQKINDPALEQKVMEQVEAQMDAEIQKALMRLSSATSAQDLSGYIHVT